MDALREATVKPPLVLLDFRAGVAKRYMPQQLRPGVRAVQEAWMHNPRPQTIEKFRTTGRV